MPRMVCGVSLLLALGMTTGCGSDLFQSHVKEFDLMRGLAADAATRLGEGTVSQASVSGQGIDPGVVVEAAVVYRASARYAGLAGQFSVASHGTLGPPVNTQAILAIMNATDLNDTDRLNAIRDLFTLETLDTKGD